MQNNWPEQGPQWKTPTSVLVKSGSHTFDVIIYIFLLYLFFFLQESPQYFYFSIVFWKYSPLRHALKSCVQIKVCYNIYTQAWSLLLSLNIYNVIMDFSPDNFFKIRCMIKFAFWVDWSSSWFLFDQWRLRSWGQ